MNPTNVMGTTKLMGERLMTAANDLRQGLRQIYASTRFGNVLGSRGSVVPLFKRQISTGGPVTLTDPEMTRFIMTLEDALTAAEAGVDAIVVSNHGGRVLDGCQSSVEVLPEIVKAVGGRIEILVDGGFRRGTDVLKALALGAKGVLIGRPICWGLGAGGSEGVAHVLQMLTSEFIRTMILTNVPDVKHVPRDTVVTP